MISEFPSLAQAIAAHDSPGYQAALKALGEGAVRDIRIIEGGVNFPSSRASGRKRARPGTHTPCPIETPRRMGPRLRGDDTLPHGFPPSRSANSTSVLR